MRNLKFIFTILFIGIFMMTQSKANNDLPIPLKRTTVHFDFLEDHFLYPNTELLQAPTDEELIQTVKDALTVLYNSKKVKLGSFDLEKDGDEVTVVGGVEIYKNSMTVSSTFTTSRELQNIKLSFRPGTKPKGNFDKLSKGAKIKHWFPKGLQKNIVLDHISVDYEGDIRKPTDLSVAVSSASSWTMIDGGVLKMNNITGGIDVGNLTGSRSYSSNLAGSVTISGTTIGVEAAIGNSKEAWNFKGELQDLSITDLVKSVVGSINGTPMPDGFVDASIVTSSFTVAPAAKKFTLSGTGAVGGQNLGDLQFLVEPKGKGKGLGFMVGIAPSQDFKLANIDAGLSIIDDLNITNFGLVLSSDARPTANLDVFERLGGDSNIGRGLNFIGAYDLRPTGLNDLIGVESLMVRAVLSNRFTDMLLEASVNTNIPIGDIATFKKIKFKLKPSNMEVSMGGEMEVKVEGDVLVFNASMGVDIADQAIFVEGSMDGMWNDPFGAKGLAIGDLWMKFGVSFRTTPIPLPEMGIAGKLKAKEFEGDLMLVINLNNPTESAIDVGFNEIDVKAILESFCDKQTLSKIPQELRSTILDISLKDARLTVVPRPMNINNTSYDAGFRVKGDASMGDDLAAHLDISVGYDGIEAKAGMKAIHHAPFFELKGARGNPDPMIEIVAKTSKDPKVAITGSATVLGITAEADMMLNDKGFDMYMKGKIFDAFQASLEVSGSRVKDGGSFRVAATMEQDFLEYFTKHASEEIDKATEQTQNDIQKAQDDVTAAQREVAKLESTINDLRRTVQGERDRDLKRLRDAEQAVANERAKVQKWQSDIDAAHRAIADIDRKVKSKDKWINDGGDPFTIAARGTESIPFFADMAAKRLAKMGEIATLETGKFAADKSMLLAQEFVGTLHYIGNEVPIDMDPRVAGVIASKETAIGSMEAAKYIMEGGKIVGVGTLQGTKWILENGPLGVVNVTYAHFEGKLSMANGGSVTLHIKGTFADSPFDEKVTFNFNNPLDEVIKFADSLLD